MSILVTLQNHSDNPFPVEEESYVFTEGMVPRVGESIHLHDQSRVAKVERVIYMAQDNPHAGSRKPGRPYCCAVVLVVTGNDPNFPWPGRYS